MEVIAIELPIRKITWTDRDGSVEYSDIMGIETYRIVDPAWQYPGWFDKRNRNLFNTWPQVLQVIGTKKTVFFVAKNVNRDNEGDLLSVDYQSVGPDKYSVHIYND